MASERRQLNIRLDPDTADRFDRLLPAVSAALGVTLSQAQLVGLALRSLEKEYPPADPKPKRGGSAK